MENRRLPHFESATFSALFDAALPSALESLLGEFIRTRRWFRGKARSIRAIEVLDHTPLRAAPRAIELVFIQVSYSGDASESYVLPLAFEPDADSTRANALFELTLAKGGGRGVVVDPSGTEELSQLLLELFVRSETPGARGRIHANPSPVLKASAVRDADSPSLEAHVPSGEQSNTTVFFGQEFMLKVFRQLEAGENPDVELNEFLWASGYRHIPEPLGSVRYDRPDFSATLGIAQRFVPSEGTAWDATLEILTSSFETALALDQAQARSNMPASDLLDSAREAPPESLEPFLAAYSPFATLLAERTAELHTALASNERLEAFKPEPFSLDYQRSMVEATRERIARSHDLLARQLGTLPDHVKPLAQQVLSSRERRTADLDSLDQARIRASRIRCHGDYHLGQVLYGESEFTILDFEGEPAQSIEARRLKRSALYDVCGMLRSFHYAATVALQSERWANERERLAPWAEAWYRWTCAQFLCAYLSKAREGGKPALFLPEAADELRVLLRLHMIDKCSYELSYELNNRPAWVGVPIAGLLSLAKQ